MLIAGHSGVDLVSGTAATLALVLHRNCIIIPSDWHPPPRPNDPCPSFSADTSRRRELWEHTINQIVGMWRIQQLISTRDTATAVEGRSLLESRYVSRYSDN